MTQTTKDKALALFNEVLKERGAKPYTYLDLDAVSNKALCRAIEQHEAFRQEVSDALEQAQIKDWDAHPILWPFLIPKPKPDPLVEAWIEATGNTVGMEPLNAALDARGLEIREKNDETIKKGDTK